MAFSAFIGSTNNIIITATTTPQTVLRPAMPVDSAGISGGPLNVGVVGTYKNVLISNASATIAASVTAGSATTIVNATTTAGMLVPPMSTIILHMQPDDDRLSIMAMSTTAIVGVSWGSADALTSG